MFVSASLRAEDPKFDLVIRNGKIVDGTGNPWFFGDVAVKGDRIVAVGRIPAGTSKIEINAKGLVVAPGRTDPGTADRRISPSIGRKNVNGAGRTKKLSLGAPRRSASAPRARSG